MYHNRAHQQTSNFLELPSFDIHYTNSKPKVYRFVLVALYPMELHTLDHGSARLWVVVQLCSAQPHVDLQARRQHLKGVYRGPQVGKAKNAVGILWETTYLAPCIKFLLHSYSCSILGFPCLGFLVEPLNRVKLSSLQHRPLQKTCRIWKPMILAHIHNHMCECIYGVGLL